MRYELFFPTAPELLGPSDDNLDVCVSLENGERYTLVVATPAYLHRQMLQDGMEHLRPGMPLLFVKQLTRAAVCALVEDLIRDLPLLRLYGTDMAECFFPGG